MSPPMRSNPPEKGHTRGPVIFVFQIFMGLLSVSLSAWIIGTIVSIAGCLTFWSDRCERHASDLVQEDLSYIAAAPQSLLVGDTTAFSTMLLGLVQQSYEKLGLLRWYERWHTPTSSSTELSARAEPDSKGSTLGGISRGTRVLMSILSQWMMITMWVAQDVLLRLSVAVYAIPAFGLACLLGVLDGMVRRDLRRWGGGRESSFVYHHAKHYTLWALTGGFGLYLSWPLGGFNPAYMVLFFTVLVAATLSTTVGAFKKYL